MSFIMYNFFKNNSIPEHNLKVYSWHKADSNIMWWMNQNQVFSRFRPMWNNTLILSLSHCAVLTGIIVHAFKINHK